MWSVMAGRHASRTYMQIAARVLHSVDVGREVAVVVKASGSSGALGNSLEVRKESEDARDP